MRETQTQHDLEPTTYVGIDVAKDKLDVTVLRGERSCHRVIANTPAGFAELRTWLSEPAEQVRVCLEATGSYSDAIVCFLVEQGITVSVLNTAVLVAYRATEQVRSKTDAADAQLLARYGREKQPPAWHPLPAEIQTLRALLAHRDDLKQMLQQERNRLEAGRGTEWTRQQIQAHVAYLQTQLKQVEQQLWTHLKAHAALQAIGRRLQTIGGIGVWGAAYLLAHIGEIARFPKVGALVSLAGLAIKARLSGRTVRGRPLIDHHGRRDLRAILYMCALSAMRHDAHMRAWAQRLRAAGKPNKVVIVAVMRKLLHIVYGVWKTQCDYNPQLAFASAA